MADIELVIKIPEEVVKNNDYVSYFGVVSEKLIETIKNGTPLPKGHGDLKDQKDLAKSLYDYQWVDQQTYIEVTNRLINTPTIIEAETEEDFTNECKRLDGDCDKCTHKYHCCSSERNGRH